MTAAQGQRTPPKASCPTWNPIRPISPIWVHRPPLRISTPTVASKVISTMMKTVSCGRTSVFQVSVTNGNGEASAKVA
jgi:hypothetical protein